MNKITKGAIAGGVGVALLLGGAGTLAYWNDSASIGAESTITAGELSIALLDDSSAWTVSNGDTVENESITNINTFRAVPGDVLTYTATFEVTANGDNLAAEVELANGSIVAAESGDVEANAALAAQLNATVVSTIGENNATEVTLDQGTHAIDVTVTITWPFGDASSIEDDNDAMTGAISLEDFAVTVTQIQP